MRVSPPHGVYNCSVMFNPGQIGDLGPSWVPVSWCGSGQKVEPLPSYCWVRRSLCELCAVSLRALCCLSALSSLSDTLEVESSPKAAEEGGRAATPEEEKTFLAAHFKALQRLLWSGAAASPCHSATQGGITFILLSASSSRNFSSVLFIAQDRRPVSFLLLF